MRSSTCRPSCTRTASPKRWATRRSASRLSNSCQPARRPPQKPPPQPPQPPPLQQPQQQSRVAQPLRVPWSEKRLKACLGRCVKVWWAEQPGDNWTEGWYAAKVVALSPLDNPTSLRLHYADGDKRWYDNHDEVKRKGNLKWHWLDLEWIPDDDRAEGGSRAPVR
mmetsp:Transcript_38827/g.96238  ORF Transcript_38827/g.96238 Transcript_38827/m.96238 type:complete len:165 (+) Transcript_38827:767-1261(+)